MVPEGKSCRVLWRSWLIWYRRESLWWKLGWESFLTKRPSAHSIANRYLPETLNYPPCYKGWRCLLESDKCSGYPLIPFLPANSTRMSVELGWCLNLPLHIPCCLVSIGLTISGFPSDEMFFSFCHFKHSCTSFVELGLTLCSCCFSQTVLFFVSLLLCSAWSNVMSNENSSNNNKK